MGLIGNIDNTPGGVTSYNDLEDKPILAPSNAQKNSDITKEEIEAKLVGELTSHSHASSGGLTHAQILAKVLL